MQIITKFNNNEIKKLELPDPEEPIMPGIYWGRIDQLFTPAFWSAQTWFESNNYSVSSFRIGNSIEEEIVACTLGGYGIPAEIGLAAFNKLRKLGLISSPPPPENIILKALNEPLLINSRVVHYRFAKQRAKYLHTILKNLFLEDVPVSNHFEFRNWLLGFPGIGLKTASWITRNWLNSDSVAILDIHILRAGKIIGLFSPNEYPAKDYLIMEDKFISFANMIQVQPSKLDNIIWSQMRDAGKIAIRLLERIQDTTLVNLN